MTQIFKKLNRSAFTRGWPALFLVCAVNHAVSAPQVVLQLKNGDRISGLIISETTNQVVISNAWVKALAVPISDVAKREVKTAPAIAGKPAALPAHTVAATKASLKLKTQSKSKAAWHGQINVGTSVILSATDQQDYSGHANFVYTQPYKSDPKLFFRNTSDFGGEYQRTDGQQSANNAHASNKSDFDLWKKYYAYGYLGTGYDDIQKIDFQYQAGPGAGVHLIQRPKFDLDTEAGVTYQTQYNRDSPNLETLYARLAEDVTWEIRKNLKLTENVAFYPDLEHECQYHNDFTSTLNYGFWKHLSLILTVADHYNTQLGPGVDPNEFDFRSSLGFTF